MHTTHYKLFLMCVQLQKAAFCASEACTAEMSAIFKYHHLMIKSILLMEYHLILSHRLSHCRPEIQVNMD